MSTSDSADKRKLLYKQKMSQLNAYDNDDFDIVTKEGFEGGIRKLNSQIIFVVLAFFIILLTVLDCR